MAIGFGRCRRYLRRRAVKRAKKRGPATTPERRPPCRSLARKVRRDLQRVRAGRACDQLIRDERPDNNLNSGRLFWSISAAPVEDGGAPRRKHPSRQIHESVSCGQRCRVTRQRIDDEGRDARQPLKRGQCRRVTRCATGALRRPSVALRPIPIGEARNVKAEVHGGFRAATRIQLKIGAAVDRDGSNGGATVHLGRRCVLDEASRRRGRV